MAIDVAQKSGSNSKGLFTPVKPDVQLPKQEEEILRFWDENQIFEKSIANQKTATGQDRKHFSFYDGPPFATGLPHYGHILAGTLKDIVPRYWTMQGYSVARRFGWDCHGLPVEYEINKSLKLHSRKAILDYGVAKYNQACRSIVQRYSSEWKAIVKRVGRWVDMENAYFTMDLSFMESVWWVFSELYKKGLIYEGYKVVPYSTGISTPLSNFEANLNYKQVQDPAITVGMKATVISDSAKKHGIQEGDFLLAWTTTPWTLPSNLALAVGQDFNYIRAKELATGRIVILAESLLSGLYKKPSDEVKVLSRFSGKDLLGIRYEPLFPYFKEKQSEGAFVVVHSDHVTLESGVGIVHIAPAFGEDDYFVCLKNGIGIVNPVDDDGCFTHEVPDYFGKRVKDADKEIIQRLKIEGKLFKQETINHSYPYCWRTDTPLIYRAVSSWFLAVEKLKDEILKANATTNWIPDHLRDGRFGKWLENARDWALTRNRFWGTPIPIWKNNEGEVICISSKEELERLSGKKVDDLHIEFVDQIEIPSPTGRSPLKRTGGVLDCWFESGSMPYAQWGYPKTHVSEFQKNFPADFIAEGLDQTRGWFYTLMVISTALFQKAPFRNVIVNGLILAEDGKKMSKSLKNYPDPMVVLNEHGADALRLYMIDSPVVRAQELRFSEKGVKEIVRRILLRWWNAYSFFVNYANIDGFKPIGDYEKSPNILDQWLLSRLNSLIQNTEKEMAAYRLYNVVPSLLNFIEELTNTYIRFNRRHFWSDGMPNEKRYAYETLFHALHSLSRIMAPFAPFLSEVTYQNLRRALDSSPESVHLESYPTVKKELIRPDLEESVDLMNTLVMLGRNHREKIGVKAKIPLKSLRIIHRNSQVLNRLKLLENYFKDELNVREVIYDSNEDAMVQISVKPNFPVLGKRFGAQMKAAASEIQGFQLDQILRLEKGEEIQVLGQPVTLADVEIRRVAKDNRPDLVTHQKISIEMDRTVTEEQQLEGLAREIIRKIQAKRKEADLNYDDRIHIQIALEGRLFIAATTHQQMIQKEALCTKWDYSSSPEGQWIEDTEIDGEKIRFGIRLA